MKIYSIFFSAIAMVALFSSCEDDDPDPINEEEVITTLRYVLTPVGGGADVTMSFTDLDGDGGNAPVIVGGTLEDSTDYNGTLTLLNESETPADDIGEEVTAEAEEHQFFFRTGGGLEATVSYNDQDANGNPLGMASMLQTGAAGQGTLTITLRHEPVKDAAGVPAGDITNAGGETDIEVTFDVIVQ